MEKAMKKITALFITLLLCFISISLIYSDSDAENNNKKNKEWKSIKSLPSARSYHSSVVYKGYIYVIGGFQNNKLFNDVLYASIKKDGTISNWEQTTSLPNNLYGHVNFVNNGYLYVVGGWNGGSGTLRNILYASINNDGTIGNWKTANSFSTQRSFLSSVIHNNFIYILGGENNNSALSDVQYAPINKNGTIGKWKKTKRLPSARYFHSSVVNNGYIYVIGGGYHDGNNHFFDDVYYAKIKKNGSIGGWKETTNLPSPQRGHDCIVHDGNLYVTGGWSGGDTLNNVLYASINADGSIGNWNSTRSFSTSKDNHTSVISNGFLYIIGGMSYGNIYKDVQCASIKSLLDYGIPLNDNNKLSLLGINIYQDIEEKKVHYKPNILVWGSYLTLSYGYNKNWDNVRGGASQSSPHVIYYQSPGGDCTLFSILILGRYNGDPNKKFYFILEDVDGNPFYISKEYPFGDFSTDEFILREYKINLGIPPKEFFINLVTNSTGDNGLFIHGAKSATSYSYTFNPPGVYKNNKNENWGIFVKFKKAKKDDTKETVVPICEIVKNNSFKLKKSFRGDTITYIYQNRSYTSDDIIDIENNIIKNFENIIFNDTTINDLIDMFGKPSTIIIKKLNKYFGAVTFRYGNIFFRFAPDEIVVKIIDIINKDVPCIYADKIQIGSTIKEVLKVVGKPKRIINNKEITWKDRVLYSDINGKKGHAFISYESFGVQFYFWDNKVSGISLFRSKGKSKKIMKLTYKEREYIKSTSFIQKYKKIYHLSEKHLDNFFISCFDTPFYNIWVYGFNKENYYKYNRHEDMSDKFSVFNYIKSNEKEEKMYEVIKLFFDISKEEIDNQVSETSSLILYKERENKEPILLLAAYDVENMRGVYRSLKNKKTINNGSYILSH